MFNAMPTLWPFHSVRSPPATHHPPPRYNCRNVEYRLQDGKVRTRALEYHIADHCNLRCDHCCSFSPILKKWFADPDEFERDLRAVSRVVAPEFVKIVGGEPLLHPEIERLLIIARPLAVAPRAVQDQDMTGESNVEEAAQRQAQEPDPAPCEPVVGAGHVPSVQRLPISMKPTP
jgi:Radical SAM superfamily